MYKRVLSVLMIFAFAVSVSACSYFMPIEKKIIAPKLQDSEKVIMPSVMIRKGDLILMYDIAGSFIPEPSKLHSAEAGINGIVHEVYFTVGDFVSEGDLVIELNTDSIVDKIHIQEINVEKLRLAHEQNLAAYETGKADRYTVELSKLSLESAENYLSDLNDDLQLHYIHAPADGVLVYINFDNGDNAFGDAIGVAKIEDGIFEVLISSNTGDAGMTPPQMELIGMEIGDEILVMYEGVEYEGEILRDYSTHHVEFGFDAAYNHVHIKTIEIPERIGFNKPVTIRNITEQALGAVVIPMNAVYDVENDPYTYVINGEEFEKRFLELGMNDGIFYEVTEGLTPGESILKIN